MIISDNLKSALYWNSIDYFFRFLLSFLVTVVLSRILAPEEFGLIALLSLFVGLSSSFSDGGMTLALIQSQNVSDVDISTVFWYNFFVSIIFSSILFVLAPWISTVFSEPVLNNLTKILSLTIIVNSLGSVHTVLCTKNFDFKTLMKVGSIATVSSGIFAISLALLGCGVWSLAGQALLASIVSTVLLWHFSSWKPVLIFKVSSIIKFLKFGGFLCVADIMDLFYNKLYVAVLGRLYGFSQLGLFHRAYTLQQVPVSIISGVVDRISFPLFSKVSSDKCKLREMVQLSIKLTMFFCVPVMFGLAVVADIIISVIFGEKWTDCIPVFQILCFAGVLWPMHVINLSALKAQGHSKTFLKIDIFKKLIGSFVLLSSSFFGIIALSLGIVIVGAIGLIINTYFTGKFLNYGFPKQIKDVFPFFAVGVLMSLLILYFKNFDFAYNFIKLILLILFGIFSYVSMGLILNITFFKTIAKYFFSNIIFKSLTNTNQK